MLMSNTFHTETYDVAVIGAGHAGCEAALACARLGLKTVLFTVSIESIALMPCNPNIGGTSKGHLVREIDALGGEMGKTIDASFIQSKMLNSSKGPAVHSLRAQADKKEYTQTMRNVLQSNPNIVIKQSEISDINVENSEIVSVRSVYNRNYLCKAAIVCTGTYLSARCIVGETSTYCGPNGLQAANHLSSSLQKLGIRLKRFKTGTPARIDGKSIDFSKMTIQNGDERIVPFSFETDEEEIQKEQVPCYLTYTNSKTHEIINRNIHRAPMFSGDIKGTGPRYCPSIEDKIVRFADKDRHQVFVEPEGLYTNEMYIDGMSTSLPEDVQIEMYRSVEGLENAHIVRNGYAIEYDCIDSTQLLPTMEHKEIQGLFFAGQINGSSGYEEAAAQGLMAGINVALKIRGKEPLIIDRATAYIGVLIDDLISKEINEPYRMMTSRAEYRLLLRQDNADERLTEIGYRIGLISQPRYERFQKKMNLIEQELNRIKKVNLAPTEQVNQLLISLGSSEISNGINIVELIKRPELSYGVLKSIDPERPELPAAVTEQVNIKIKYAGYIERQERQVEHFKKIETKRLSPNIDYSTIKSLSNEGRQKLMKYRPLNIGQASRIAGVSPADISVLLVSLGIK